MTAPTVAPIISLDYLKSTFLPSREGVSRFDAKLLSLILTATEMIETHCRRHFTYQSITEYFTTRNATLAMLDLYGDSQGGFPVTGIAIRARQQQIFLSGWNIDDTVAPQVWYDPLYVFDPTLSLLQQINTDPSQGALGGDYLWDPDAARIFLHYTTRHARNALKVTYSAGYQPNSQGDLTDSAEERLKVACALQTVYLNNKSALENVGITEDRSQGKTGSGRYSTFGGVIPEVVDLLKPFRRMVTSKS